MKIDNKTLEKEIDEISYLNDFVSKLDNREETINDAKYIRLNYNKEYEKKIKEKQK